MQGFGGLAQRTIATANDIAEALSVSAPPPQLGPGLPGPQGTPPPAPHDPGDSMLGNMTDFKSPPLAAALQGGRGAESLQGPTGFAEGGHVRFRVNL